ncbi:CAAX protease [Achromobacter aegrifaciens]|uniref:CAAX protease n=1 Tax=Achromobacter aegrifaciens TaxID=1287736 RepID=UPI002790CEDA|nr:CAAX protease [Achromobacter aegrifaciens]MDQ1762254.1 CAAX protease [Achromobacter aegrifaciens]
MEAITNLTKIVCISIGRRQRRRPDPSSRFGDMLHTLQYRPLLIDTLITNERIGSYQSVFQPANDMELVGAYLWNAHACGALYPLMGAVEVTLRNAIDQALVADLGRFWWAGGKLRYLSFAAGVDAPHAVQAVRENFAKATRNHVAEQRRRHAARGNVTPQHHGIIAKTEFSTWEFLLDGEFMGRGLIWPKHLSAVFRGKWPLRQAGAMLAHVHDLVATLCDFRNRLFHHEPAWKRYGVLTETDAVQHLEEKAAKAESLLELIHPENLRLLQANGLLRNARRACSSAEIRRFQHLAQTHRVNSLAVLTGLVARSAQENSALVARLDPGQDQHFLILPR